MVSKSTFSCVASLLLICFLLTQNISSDCRWVDGDGCFSNKPAVFQAFQSRKVLRAIELKEMEEKVNGRKRAPVAGWDELRRVPSGPDPLHHNGGNPKKPRTP